MVEEIVRSEGELNGMWSKLSNEGQAVAMMIGFAGELYQSRKSIVSVSQEGNIDPDKGIKELVDLGLAEQTTFLGLYRARLAAMPAPRQEILDSPFHPGIEATQEESAYLKLRYQIRTMEDRLKRKPEEPEEIIYGLKPDFLAFMRKNVINEKPNPSSTRVPRNRIQ